MQSYIAKRLFLFIPTMLLVSIIVFTIMRIVPGDPALMLLSQETGGDFNFTEEAVANLRAKLGTDKPIHTQYFIWTGDMLRGDFGTSFFYESSPVIDDLIERIPTTLELTLFSLLLASMVALPLGVLSAIKQDSPTDYLARVVTLIGVALPNFWVAVMTIYFLVLLFQWAPPLAYEKLWDDPWTNLQQVFFPAVALGVGQMAFLARVTRSAMLEVLREDYIRTARSKGLAERVIIFRHAFRNVLLPVVTITGLQLGYAISGTVIIETIFLIPGMGRLLITSVQHRDFPVVQGIVMMIALLVLVMNLVTDVLYAWLNPRVRYS